MTKTRNLADLGGGFIQAGTAGTPGLKFTGDNNTGIYSPGADQVAISTAGSERLAVGASGNITIPSGGNLGINGAAPQSPLDVISNSSSYGISIRGRSGDNLSQFRFASNNFAAIYAALDSAPTYLAAQVNGSERLRIPSSGGILLNTTSRIDDGLATIGFAGSIQKGLVLNDTDPANTRVFIAFDINGTTQIGYISNSNNTGVTYSTTSDYRLKENVVAVTDSITRLQQLKPSRFNFIAAPGHTVDGFLAHEVQTVVPEAITGTKDAVDDNGNPVYQGIDQSKLVPLLTAALQEAIGEIESLKARVAALEAN